MKKLIGVFMLISMLAALTACGGAPAPAGSAEQPEPTAAAADGAAAPEAEQFRLSPEEQKQILEANRELWEFKDYYNSPWYYAFTDLDHNGRLEVIAATTQGSGIYTYGNLWEVLPDGSGVGNSWHENVEIEGPDDWPEVILESLPCYYDASSDRYYYPCEGITRSGYNYQYYAWYALCLKDGVAEWEFLASKAVEWLNEGQTMKLTCEDAQGNPITEQEYDTAVERRFAGMEKTELSLDWTTVEIPWEEEVTSIFQEGPAVVITKNPTSETISVGGKTWFIAHADNAVSLTWQLLDPNGAVYSLEEVMQRHPGLSLQALEGDTLAVSNVPISLNGWGIQAVFDGEGNVAVTEPAYLYVGEFVSAYNRIIDAYRTAYSSGRSKDNEYLWGQGLSEMTAYSSGVGYALKDLDKNGVPELIIAGMGTEDFSDRMVYDLYTLVNGVPVNLATSYARMRYYMRTDNTLMYEGSGGASYTYITLERVNGSTMEETEMVFTDYDSANNATVFYSQQGHSDTFPSEKSVRITEDEFFDRWEQWKSGVYIPPLTTIF